MKELEFWIRKTTDYLPPGTRQKIEYLVFIPVLQKGLFVLLVDLVFAVFAQDK